METLGRLIDTSAVVIAEMELDDTSYIDKKTFTQEMIYIFIKRTSYIVRALNCFTLSYFIE